MTTSIASSTNQRQIPIPEIHTDFQGFKRISNIYNDALNTNDDFAFDFSNSKPIEANMCAVLGLIFEVLKTKKKNFYLTLDDRSRTNLTLSKNGFYNLYHQKKLLNDVFDTVIDYRVFNHNIDVSFAQYTSDFFREDKNGLSSFSKDILKEFRRSLGEIASNTQQHSESRIFVTCGQLFPNEKKLKFTMSDSGIGFANHIKKNRNLDMDNKKAIKWALTGNNSARPINNGVPGGLGLKNIRDFIQKNKGELYIISHDGCYQNIGGATYSQNIYPALPGTIVSLVINC